MIFYHIIGFTYCYMIIIIYCTNNFHIPSSFIFLSLCHCISISTSSPLYQQTLLSSLMFISSKNLMRNLLWYILTISPFDFVNLFKTWSPTFIFLFRLAVSLSILFVYKIFLQYHHLPNVECHLRWYFLYRSYLDRVHMLSHTYHQVRNGIHKTLLFYHIVRKNRMSEFSLSSVFFYLI